MSKTFVSRPAASQRDRGRGRGEASTRTPAVIGESIPSSTATRGRGAVGLGASGATGRENGGGATSLRPIQGAGALSRPRQGAGALSRPRQGAGALSKPRQGAGASTQASSSSLQDRTQHTGAYTVIRPDEKRRKQVAEQAEREARQYDDYRKQNKPTSFSYVGTAGGGESLSLSLPAARQQQIHSQALHSKANRLMREQERRSQQKQEEGRALADRKVAARKQTSSNVQKQKETAEQRKAEMNRVNQAFLDRLEAQSKHKGGASS